jgi:2-amino-4-hydroxy-6-hydroxymethyldihydropteridine diphosphokinase
VVGDNDAMATACLGLGTNLGDRPRNLARAADAIAALPGVDLTALAEPIETPPMGPQDQGPFLNSAATLETAMDPHALHAALQQIELDLGRAPVAERTHWGPRLIDIDLLLFGERVIATEALTVPHPGMHERGFVLRPLATLAPDAVHPIRRKTVAQLLAELEPMAPTALGVARG